MCKVHRSSDMWEYMLLVASSLWHALNGCLWVVVVVSPKNEKTVNLLHLVISTRRRSGNREPIGGIGIGTRTGSDFTTGTSREYSEYRFTSITTRLKSSPVSGSVGLRF